jgi:hypothetical protein
VNSIAELNNCLDKKDFQSKLNRLSAKELDKVETHVADRIIDNYEQEKKEI